MELKREEIEKDLERQRKEEGQQRTQVANTRASMAVLQKQLDDGERHLQYLIGRRETLEQVLDMLGGPTQKPQGPATAPGRGVSPPAQPEAQSAPEKGPGGGTEPEE